MSAPLIFLTALRHCLLTAGIAFFGLGRLVLLAVRPRAALAAENLFLRKQSALFQERQAKPRRANDAIRWLMAAVSRLFDWPDSARDCQARYPHPLAPQGIPTLLALELQADGTTTAAQ